MNPVVHLRGAWADFFSAVQFLTRIPVPACPYDAGALARSVKFFPLVGAIVGSGAALVHLLVAPHLPRPAAALLVLLFLVLVTGGLHEDGLADAADGFGGGASQEKILIILRDSRIGSYGGLALAFSLLGRVILIAALPSAQAAYYLIAGGILSRWTALPLSYFLSPARISEDDGLGARIARHTSAAALLCATVLTFGFVILLLKGHAIAPIIGVIMLAWLTGMYYKKRIAGITGDCFGATIQLAEIGAYLCGAWTR